MNDAMIARIEREAGVPGLLDVLASRLAPTDIQSLLIEAQARRAGATTPAHVLAQYQSNRFVAPSTTDPRSRVEIERLAWAALPAGYEPIDLAPLCPLGTCSVVAGISQHRSVSTVRNTDVLSDSTNVLALECAVRRRRLLQTAAQRSQAVKLAASARLTRAQLFQGKGMFAHFQVISLCAAGRDEGFSRFEMRQLVEQISFYVTLLEASGATRRDGEGVRVAVTDWTGRLAEHVEEHVLRPLAERFTEARCHIDATRTMGRGYYDSLCFKLYASTPAEEEIELVDGGATDWTRRLLGYAKERLVISGLGLDRLCSLLPGVQGA